MREKLEYDKYVSLRDRYNCLVNRLASGRLIVFIIMIFSFILSYYYYELLFRVISVISLILFVVLIIIHDKYFKLYDYYYKYVDIINTYLDRENGKWRDFLDKGEDFISDKNAFLEDLDIMGNNSLYQYLSICKTVGGRRNLASKLSNLKFSKTKLKLEQEAINELTNKINFDIDFQVYLSKYDNKKIDFGSNIHFLESSVQSKGVDMIIALICSVGAIILFVLGLLKVISFNYFYGMFIFNYLISFMYSYIFGNDFKIMDDTIRNYGGLRDIFMVIVNNDFSSSKLVNISNDMKKGMDSVRLLGRLDNMNSVKSNILTNFICNGLFCFNIMLMYSFSKFLSMSIDELEKGIMDVEELEGMISIATVGIVKRDTCIPVYSDKIEIDVANIRHPLLDDKVCVGNDFYSGNGVNIITGSNMGGKTSFLRTIGINLILMGAGGYVCADTFSSNYFKIFTSMRIKDDTMNGISTFYGELIRIRDAIKYVDKGNMLVLIDEIFKGTNYQDRIYGAREVIKKLSNNTTIAFITTHDFELCDVDNVYNYHVKEYYEGDKINFDYKIRRGKCNSTNARYLMRKLNIIKE